MPCNLTARADAKVSNETLAKLLTTDVVKKSLELFFTQRNTEVNLSAYGNAVYAYWGNFAATVREGKVDVSGLNRVECQQFAEAITAHLTQVAGLLLQQQIQKLVAQKFAIESAQVASNGALVLTVEI